MEDYIKDSVTRAQEKSGEKHLFNIPIFILEPFINDIKLNFVIKKIESILPREFLKNIESIYVGVFEHLNDIDANAAYKDGTIYLSNVQDDESDIIDDIVHEIAHAVAKHSVERASRNVAVNVITQVTDALTGGKLSTVNRTTGINTIGLLTRMGIMNPFNRKQETEADYLGLIFASLSGYDIRETINLGKKFNNKFIWYLRFIAISLLIISFIYMYYFQNADLQQAIQYCLGIINK